MKYNFKKCCFVCFSKTHDLGYNYTLGNHRLERVNNVKELGIIIDSERTFKNLFEHVELKVSKKIAFIKRFNKKSVGSFKSLYYSYIFSSISYASVLWRPFMEYAKFELGKLNHKYPRYVSYRVGRLVSPINHEYRKIHVCTGISNIESHMEGNDSILSFKIYNTATQKKNFSNARMQPIRP